ncbi:hypothetical protein H6S82_05105 [Planktothrix sp. FACHB-1355]|uniref:Uncharacterized protein n=1 Tax=Aerosakkonema funiforme FACHB-1375 TaxID=2949571 RepID=A0A926ZM79_9CYAN|nr:MULTISPECIES: hypothetical protein [Oscillatoriales]MBD2185811.1 hypothetical protein [Aerosakkonema funiforme FACHB-1375]MBD3558233.1 hypothetical protein [Planktothrix sp. FACHB-1355]
MYQELQDFLTFAIEAVAIIGYGGIFAHYIFIGAFAKQLASPASETIPTVFTSQTEEQTETVSTDATNTTERSTTNTTICTVETSSTNTNCTTLEVLELGQIEKLTLRQCRAVIRSLNATLPKSDRIRLKINGKDAPTSWLRSQIKKHLEDRQQQLIPSIQQTLQAS